MLLRDYILTNPLAQKHVVEMLCDDLDLFGGTRTRISHGTPACPEPDSMGVFFTWTVLTNGTCLVYVEENHRFLVAELNPEININELNLMCEQLTKPLALLYI